MAWHLAPALDNAGYAVQEVYSRNPQHAAQLTDRLYQAEVKDTLDFSDSEATLFIIAVSDDHIPEIAREIILPDDAILVHTSGAVALDQLNYAATPRIGVFYPLQSFTKKQKIDFKQVPLFIEGSDEETEAKLLTIARAISNQVRSITSEDRQALHVAAVFASNFTNHMLRISEELLQKHGLEFAWIKPLIAETINKSLEVGPANAQTGPARRGDVAVLEKHMALLRDDPRTAELYHLISQHILDQYFGD